MATSTCAATPRILNFLATADPVDIELDTSMTRFLLRVREAVDATINVKGDRNLFSLKAGETYSEERLALRNPVTLQVSVAAGSTVELFTWEG